MLKKYSLLLMIVLLTLSSTVAAQTRPANDGRDADRAAIRAQIESIFQGFIDKDADKLRATHAQDWRGFLEGSPSVMKGLDSYMEVVDWAVKNKNGGMVSFKITEFDLTFEGEAAIVCFVSDVTRKAGDHLITSKLRIMDIFGKRNGNWVQIATDTNIHPEALANQNQTPGYVSPQLRADILDQREKVWRAFFANDKEALDRTIPENAVAIENGDENFHDRAEILAGAKYFAESGGKLISIEFPRTDIQMYGSAIFIYTTFKIETERGGKRTTETGRATENFVMRNSKLINVGWHIDSGK